MSKLRVSLLFILIVIAATVIVSRLFFLQFLQHGFYSALARGQQQVFETIPPERGEILLTDKNSETSALAVNREYPYVYAVPKDVEDKEKSAKILAEIIGQDEKAILDKLSKPDDLFEKIGQRLNEEQAQKIRI